MGDQNFEEARSALWGLLGSWPVLEKPLAHQFGDLLVGHLLEGPEALSDCTYAECLRVQVAARRRVPAVLATARELAKEEDRREAKRALGQIIRLRGCLYGEALPAITQAIQQEYPTVELRELRRFRNGRVLSHYVSAQGVAPGDLLRSLRQARQAFCSASLGQLGTQYPNLHALAASP